MMTPMSPTDTTAGVPVVPEQSIQTESQQMDFSSTAPTTEQGPSQGE